MSLIDRLLSALQSRRKSTDDSSHRNRPVSGHLETNVGFVTQMLSDSADFIQRQLQIGNNAVPATLFYLTGLTNETTIQESIVRPLLQYEGSQVSVKTLLETVVEAGNTSLADKLDKVVDELLRGQAIVLLEGSVQALVISARKYPGRNIEEPAAEKTTTGPREGTVEDLQQNLALVRKRLPTARFKSRSLRLGTMTQTAVVVCYMEGTVRPGLLEEVMNRLRNLQGYDAPEVLDTSYIAQAIEDHPLSPFPQTMTTERPDRVVANLLEGRVCLIVEGTPKVLIMPSGLTDQFQSPEDYYVRPLPAIVARWLRFVAAMLGTTASAVYVAVLTFHYEVIPHRLIVNVARNRALVPLPALLEALVLEIATELLREATNRLPSTVGQVIGVVGALVLGQAAAQANLVSPLLVIVVAVSTIASFAVPNNSSATALRLMRFPMIIAAGFL